MPMPSGPISAPTITSRKPIPPARSCRAGSATSCCRTIPTCSPTLSANSANNALSRDAAFTKDFLKRHQDKLHFGSDCNCEDGKGGGAAQNSDRVAPRMRGKCVAQETLKLLHRVHVKAGVPQARLDQCAPAAGAEGLSQILSSVPSGSSWATQLATATILTLKRRRQSARGTAFAGHDQAGYFPNIQRKIPGNSQPPCTSEWAPSPHSKRTS